MMHNPIDEPYALSKLNRALDEVIFHEGRKSPFNTTMHKPSGLSHESIMIWPTSIESSLSNLRLRAILIIIILISNNNNNNENNNGENPIETEQISNQPSNEEVERAQVERRASRTRHRPLTGLEMTQLRSKSLDPDTRL